MISLLGLPVQQTVRVRHFYNDDIRKFHKLCTRAIIISSLQYITKTERFDGNYNIIKCSSDAIYVYFNKSRGTLCRVILKNYEPLDSERATVLPRCHVSTGYFAPIFKCGQ